MPEAGAPSVSVVVPVGRVDGPLLEQLDALAGQVGDVAFDVVLACNVDDPVVHGHLARLAAERGGPGWRVVPAAERRGPSHARNAGARAAGGDLLLFCDGDDIVDPGWVGAMVAALATEDAATGQLLGFGLTDREVAARPPSTPGALPTFMGAPYLMCGNLGVRRAAFDAAGGFDETMATCEDIAFSWTLLVAGYRLGWAPAAIVHYRYRSGWWPLISQQVRYGRGMSRLLLRYGVPEGRAFGRPGRLLVTGNRMPGADRSLRNRVRRGSIAAGRLIGLAEVGLARR
jgi:cellulose synthase/poly-beta-1,6-N-acetylglucosamine synthase-like glycosyltransferase